ncbi:hypothetical protein FOXG_21362 [Fusarium oxysporum f. sp. lycopersici 4287]|uniref:Zn(2)-C6 fungal-type domain-containing protein n=1 Tax=Fusarium oxysporum f. sp. lycopersici (strain 4287 / CBS 123668 / FGSC 9935 / NRRL 34936) TaxID=426428 RepID=A0A0J9VT66_FUSO4|nr:hypothetical protein FOXG_20945 [Fusarium oxysporum f. sp. lycopersici 4287]XP_018253565.1 hypothetical protein FOXG_21362 [Fusarium oxysporum f. sp. lycopersici 4287]EWZ78192.1 hypothetical protein FOWG_17494 [Fusarium oxysporum f. sp. lycopersici MN25]KAJ9413072.1 hypothetical protein QL093DRAFT_2629154 [Fusarium oxysporum]KNB13840.1 hypothetical protein FOXG_20945 [Fusarium oxysporum f. sp. lycopersici 4287]KNB15520.1 hypothetical protein FOXG_21362 [Fusarium oxysporum f. sp. lycopersici
MNAPSNRHTRQTRACGACRLRKKKCEGKAPKCETCKRSNKKCTWTHSLITTSKSCGRHGYREHIKLHENRESCDQYGEEVNARGPEPEASSTTENDRTAQTLSLHASSRDSINDKSTAASQKSLEDLNYDKIRRFGEIYFQEWAPLFPALAEIEFEKAFNGFSDNTDPTSRNAHVTQIYLVVDITGILSKGHELEQLPTCAPRWQAVLDATDLEPSIQTFQCFTLSLLCYTKRGDYERLCSYMDRAIGLYKNLFLLAFSKIRSCAQIAPANGPHPHLHSRSSAHENHEGFKVVDAMLSDCLTFLLALLCID